MKKVKNLLIVLIAMFTLSVTNVFATDDPSEVTKIEKSEKNQGEQTKAASFPIGIKDGVSMFTVYADYGEDSTVKEIWDKTKMWAPYSDFKLYYNGVYLDPNKKLRDYSIYGYVLLEIGSKVF